MNNQRLQLSVAVALASCCHLASISAQTYTQTLVPSIATATGGAGLTAASATAAPDDLATFGPAVSASLGGVFDFAGTLTSGSTVVSGNVGTDRNVKVTFTKPLQNYTSGATYAASSGTRGITTLTNPGDYGFSIGSIVDPANPTVPLDGLNVTRIGFMAMSRTNAAGETAFPLDLRATVTLSNGLTKTATGALSGTKGNNVFFGFTANPQTAISSVMLEAFVQGTSTPVVARIGLDDLGLVIENSGPVAAGPSLGVITPDNSFLAPGANFNFSATSPQPINPEHVTLTLNGADYTSQLVFGGTATARTFSIPGLAPNTDYQAAVRIVNATGVGTRTYNFTTIEPVPAINEITQSGSYIPPSGAFQFQVKSYLTALNSSNLTVLINGQSDPSKTSIQGAAATDKTVTLSGFLPNSFERVDVSVSIGAGRVATRTFFFYTQGDSVVIADTHGFSDAAVYPFGPVGSAIDGNSRWAPATVAGNQLQVVDPDEPDHGRIVRRVLENTATRSDQLVFPQLANGAVKASFDVRVSDIGRRTLDVSLQTDSALMAGFIQFGAAYGKLTYYDNPNFIQIEGFELDTNWHHYEMINYLSGPKGMTFDLIVDGRFITNLPWRNKTPLALSRFRLQAVGSNLGADALQPFIDVDNLVITALPIKTEPLATPVTVTDLGQGVVYRKYSHNIYGSNQNVYVTDINLDDPSVGVKFPYSGATKRTVPQHAATVPGAVAAVNGQFFNAAGSIQYFKTNGTLVNPTGVAHDQLALTDDGAGTNQSIKVALKPAAGWESLSDPSIMACGPPLFQNGFKFDDDPADSLYTRHPRNIAAWTYDNHLLLVVIDGSSESAGMSFPEMEDYVNHLGWIKNSVNFDGGGSATMWTNGTVVNNPSDGTPRAVTNAIAVTAAPVAVPATPVGIIAVEGNNRFTLQWQLSSGATSYEIRRATSAGGAYVVVGTSDRQYFIDTTAVPGTAYYYVIVAKNSAGQSVGSTPLGINVSQGVLVVPTVSIVTAGSQVNLSFSSMVGRTYQLERSTTLLPGGWEAVGGALSGNGSVLTIQQPISTTNLFFRIKIQ